jgi:hypothetical protein
MSTMTFDGFLLRHGPLEVQWSDGVMRVTSPCTFLTENWDSDLVEALAQNDLIGCTFTVNEAKP